MIWRCPIRETGRYRMFLVGGYLAILAASFPARAQTTWASWVSDCSISGFGSCNPAAAAETANGSLVVVGTSSPFHVPSSGWATSVDASGAGRWLTSVTGVSANSAELLSVAATPSGVLAIGSSGRFHAVRFDGNGGVPWDRYYGDTSGDRGARGAVAATSDGGAAIVADRWKTGYPYLALLIKLDAAGATSWMVHGYFSLQPGATIDPLAVAQTSDGGYVIGGTESPSSGAPGDFWLARFDSTGTLLWQEAFGSSGDDAIRGVAATPDGGFVASGLLGCADADCAGSAIWVGKFLSDGSLAWQFAYPFQQFASAGTVALGIGGGTIVTGTAFDPSPGQKARTLVLKLDADGAITWQRLLGYPNDFYAAAGVLASANGGYVVNGHTSFASFLARLRSDGSFDDTCLFISTPAVVPLATAMTPVAGPFSFAATTMAEQTLTNSAPVPAPAVGSSFLCPLQVVAPSGYQRIASPIRLQGANITPGTVLKVYVATASGAVDVFPGGLAPTSTSFGQWRGVLPASVPLGNGFMSLLLVATDRGYEVSNAVGTVIIGNPTVGVPSVTGIGGLPLSPTSASVQVGVSNVEGLLVPGADVVLDGDGFADPVVNLYTVGGNIGPITPSAWTASSLTFHVPAGAPVGPGSVQVVNRPSYAVSDAVSIPIGERIRVDSVTVDPDNVTVHLSGAGLCTGMAINLFAHQSSFVLNFGGLNPDGTPVFPFTVVDSHHLFFTRPSFISPGSAYVQVLNAPFIPYTSSGNGPGGAFTMP
jgi:hypothetical protein